MRKLLAWIVVTIGIAALVRKLRGRRKAEPALPVTPPEAATPEAPPEAATEDPAEALRQKLASTREDTAVADETEVGVDDRRADVHEQGRAAIDEMQQSTEE